MQKLNNSIEKLLFIVRASNCQTITQIYAKKITSADRCKNDGITAAGRITWINNNRPEDGIRDFDWTWERCAASQEEETSFLPEGDKHKLTGGSTSGPDQDGGSMRPPRGRGAVLTPALFTPILMNPSMGPPSNRDRLDARRNEEKCKILIRHNEILYSLAIEKETKLHNANCGSYAANIPDREKRFDKKLADIKNDFLKKRSNINARKPCKKN